MVAVEDCGRCRSIFESRQVLQVEILHESLKHGQDAALALLRERLEGDHEEHSQST